MQRLISNWTVIEIIYGCMNIKYVALASRDNALHVDIRL